ncbi:hypothetical protein, partial [Aquicoccus porphyridii]|uniref:hypothetical protein n=1 Tax=Aquicoccus porphyridii TaxID=1852029 RepID=UPI001CAA8509
MGANKGLIVRASSLTRGCQFFEKCTHLLYVLDDCVSDFHTQSFFLSTSCSKVRSLLKEGNQQQLANAAIRPCRSISRRGL